MAQFLGLLGDGFVQLGLLNFDQASFFPKSDNFPLAMFPFQLPFPATAVTD
jgi:hypothetical protein